MFDNKENPLWCVFKQIAVELSYFWYVHTTKSVQSFPEALRFFEKQYNGFTRDKPDIARDALGASHPDDVALLNASAHDLLLYIETSVTYTIDRMRNTTSNGSCIYSYAASLIRQIRSEHDIACERFALKLDHFLFNYILQKKNFLLPVKKIYNQNESFSYNPAQKNRSWAAS